MPRTPRVSQREDDGALDAAGGSLIGAEVLAGGGFLCGVDAVQMRNCGGEDAFAPDSAIAGFEPFHVGANALERLAGEQLVEDHFYSLLEGAIFGAEAVGDDAVGYGGDADENRVGFHPPGQPGFELRLAAEFVYEVAVIIEDGAVADYVRGAARGVEFGGDLRVENPQLGFQCCCGVYWEMGLAGDFGDQFHVVARLF